MFTKSLHSAAEKVLPTIEAKTQKPWISARTLHYIDRRTAARHEHDKNAEAYLQRLIKASVKQDRTSWLIDLLRTGSWQEIRKLRKPVSHKQGRLKDEHGSLVSSEHRSDTMAKHFETVQWAVRPAAVIVDRPALFEELNMNTLSIQCEEVRQIMRKLHKRKAPGHDNLNPEFWIICADSDKIVQ